MEYKLNEKLIKDLREGRIALKHNMKDEELLKEVIKVAFPNDRDTPKGTTTYYFKTKINQNWWFSSTTTLPTVPLLDFIEKEEYKLPEKWCIERNKENSEIVNDYFNKKLNTKAPYNFTSDKKYVYSDITESIDYCSSKPKDYTEITFEQFQKYVLNNTKTMDKEIIGYKAPKDLFGGRVKEGHLFIYRHKSCGVDYYSAEGTYLDLPFDIVSDWEPVYKTSEKVLTLSNGKQVKIRKGEILAVLDSISSKIELSELITLLKPNLSRLKDWKIELSDATYKIGCWENITLADIKLIIKEYEELNK